MLLQASILLVASLGCFCRGQNKEAEHLFLPCEVACLKISRRFGCKPSVNNSEGGIQNIVSVALNICARAVKDAEEGPMCLALSVADGPTQKEKR